MLHVLLDVFNVAHFTGYLFEMGSYVWRWLDDLDAVPYILNVEQHLTYRLQCRNYFIKVEVILISTSTVIFQTYRWLFGRIVDLEMNKNNDIIKYINTK
jgi:hypothetical protein